VVAEVLPHSDDCADTILCHCGANAQRNKLLLHITDHVAKVTRGRVYLDR
jgi:hypothetical protein